MDGEDGIMNGIWVGCRGDPRSPIIVSPRAWAIKEVHVLPTGQSADEESWQRDGLGLIVLIQR